MAKISDIALVAGVVGGLYLLWNMGRDAFTGLNTAAQGISEAAQAPIAAVQDVGDAIYNAGYATGETTKDIAEAIYNAGYATGEATKAALANPETVSLLQAILGGPGAVGSWAAQQILAAPAPTAPAPTVKDSPVFSASGESGTVKEVRALIATQSQETVSGLGIVTPKPKKTSTSRSLDTAEREELLQKLDKKMVTTASGDTVSANEYARLRGWA